MYLKVFNILKDYPDAFDSKSKLSKYYKNCKIKIGRCLQVKRNYIQAIEQFNEIIAGGFEPEDKKFHYLHAMIWKA